MQAAVLVALVNNTNEEPAAHTWKAGIAPRDGVDEACVAIPPPDDVAMVVLNARLVVTVTLTAVPFATPVVVAPLKVSDAKPAPVYAVCEVPTPEHANSRDMMYLSLASPFTMDVLVAVAREKFIPANFAVLNVVPVGEPTAAAWLMTVVCLLKVTVKIPTTRAATTPTTHACTKDTFEVFSILCAYAVSVRQPGRLRV